MISTVLINAVALLIDINIKPSITNPIIVTEQIYYKNPVLEIPKVKLKQEVYPNDINKNHVDKGIQVISGSKMPDISNGNFILASHSGNSSIAYFKNLNQINFNDSFYIYYKDKKYRYIIGDIYDVPKTGYVEIKRNKSKSSTTLITCKKGTNMQTVYIGYLVSTEKTP